ncbi:DUF2642 domain-containing protein [Bacillus aerolatus]|uniref:DUF2642 domain-containing protein n=1 Tax=Bacillus aerolatus TaxID=2653354 RepID=A0A6I1FBU6_9BACI|nr:DUF2642 domain-containing protein [Bacillus aerolatus]KAB7704725.1 DUF2642 domain-containing protein [Bacillus aerolatus]
MTKQMKDYIGEPIHLKLSGKREVSGILIELGSDVLVLYKQNEYYYIPLIHIREIKLLTKEEADSITQPDTVTSPPLAEKLSLTEVLLAANGVFVEMSVTANQPFHGYITNTLDNYLVFFSPVYQTMLIPLQHIKWLIPYPAASRPYGFKNSMHSASSSAAKTCAPTLENQIKNMTGTFITCNIGEKESISGKLLQKEAHFIDLLTVKEQQIHINIHHIKTIVYT